MTSEEIDNVILKNLKSLSCKSLKNICEYENIRYKDGEKEDLVKYIHKHFLGLRSKFLYTGNEEMIVKANRLISTITKEKRMCW